MPIYVKSLLFKYISDTLFKILLTLIPSLQVDNKIVNYSAINRFFVNSNNFVE